MARPVTPSALAFVAMLLLSATAHAQLFRAYVASTGSDANPCNLPAPCRLLPAALAAVADGGEIWMLDSANYNTATVTVGKSVSILAVPGAVGSVVSVGGSAISISADNLKVALRNLVIVPLPAGGPEGIVMMGASTLTIEDSLIANMPVNGIRVNGAGTLKISNTTLRNNGGTAVWAENGAKVNISGTKMLGNIGGVYANSTVLTTTTLVVSDSIISGGNDGVYATAVFTGATTRILVTRCTIEGTNTALRAQTENTGIALVTVSGSMITNNNFASFIGDPNSTIKSLGNNHMQDNVNAPSGLLAVGLQ